MLHPELKPLKASLIRNEFTKFTNSKEFGLILMENNYDEFFKPFMATASALNSSARIDAFMESLSYLIVQWLRSDRKSSNSEIYSRDFNMIVLAVLEGFINWAEEFKQASQIVESLKKISLIRPETINKIEEKIKHKEIKMSETNSKQIQPEKTELNNFTEIDYAVITALEEDEMEKVIPMFNKIGEISDTKNFIEYGYLKSKPSKKVAYASQHKTGMVDASILATEMILRFKPKYLIMAGVLGGKPDETNIGDVVIATKVFEIDRGKITDLGFKKETSTANTDSREIKKIQRHKNAIETFINSKDETRSNNIKIHFGPIACVNQVIDIDGFFESSISVVERKAIALEMESYAVVRACELASNNKTIPLILKSVMDNTKAKTDDAKPYAAWTSARALEYILDNELI